MNYALGFSDGLAELSCAPEFTYADGVKALTEIVEAPWRAELESVIILDRGSTFSPTREGIKVLAVLMNALLSTPEVRIAIVVSKVVHYGIGRVIEARVGPGGDRVRVFLKEEAARQWLGMTASGHGD